MVAEAELDKRLVVIQVVAGSIPVSHPIPPWCNGSTGVFETLSPRSNRGGGARAKAQQM